MARKAVLDAVFALHGQAGVTLNNVGDKVIEKVPDATHAEVFDVLALRIKDGFEHEEFPPGVRMKQLTEKTKDGRRRHPEDCLE